MKKSLKYNWIDNWNKKHSFLFVILSFLIFILFFPELKIESRLEVYLSLFFILLIGVSHGALDNLHGRKLLEEKFKSNWKIIFYTLYIFLVFFVTLVWINFSQIVLPIFLLIAAHHFGKEDCGFIFDKKKFIHEILFIIKGSIIILAPLFMNFYETLHIFDQLIYSSSNTFKNILIYLYNNNIIKIFLLFSVICPLIFASYIKSFRLLSLNLESFAIIAINYIFPPIISFAIYFCFLHSIRHSLSLAYYLNKKKPWDGLNKFIKKSAILTIFTIIFALTMILVLMKNQSFTESSVKIIFIGLASLTLPHILLSYFAGKK